MKTTKKRARPAVRSRHPRKQTEFINSTTQFLHRTFYYLKAKQLLEASIKILGEAN